MAEFNETPDACDSRKLSVANCEPRPSVVFGYIEAVCIVIFSVDYVCRMSTVHTATPEECGLEVEPGRRSGGLRITWMYACQWLNLIDLFAIVPFYAELASGGGAGGSFAAIRVLRLVRAFRVLRMKRLRAGVEMFAKVIGDSLPALSFLLFMEML